MLTMMLLTIATTREITIGAETYVLKLTPVPCARKTVCGTALYPRRVRGEVSKGGVVVGRFDRPCAEVCVGMEKTVERSIKQ